MERMALMSQKMWFQMALSPSVCWPLPAEAKSCSLAQTPSNTEQACTNFKAAFTFKSRAFAFHEGAEGAVRP